MGTYTRYVFLILFAMLNGCDDFTEIDPPRTELIKQSVFTEATTAEAAVVDLYISLYDGFGGGDQSTITALTSLSSDELELYGTDAAYLEFNQNEVTASNPSIESMWSSAYSVVYKANAVLEGLASSKFDSVQKKQLMGEALFIRAYTYFYLVNLWGPVPLITSTDYVTNTSMMRTSSAEVYQRIVSDLVNAKSMLPNEYGGDRIRAARGAATAMLARVYLYINEWEKADTEATELINSSLYGLESDLRAVFGRSSREAILQIWYSPYPREVITYLIHPTRNSPLFGSLTSKFAGSFETGDLRYPNWINEYSAPLATYYGANKYDFFDNPADDYATLLRLAEQYLIRAEVRVQRGDLSGAVTDLNTIRLRAGLLPISPETAQEILDAIYLERKHELFVEQGHRWLDLKRTGRARAILAPLKSTWDDSDTLYPIPETQLISNPHLSQNPIGS